MIRKPVPEEAGAVRTMWEECFPEGGPRFVDWYFGEVYSADRTLGLFEDGVLLSNLQMVPYTLRLRGRDIPMDTLTGVATGGESRNRGYARAVMAEALADMAGRGLGFTFLYPFNHQFYQRLGWETCSVALEYLKPAVELPDAPPTGWQAHAAEPDSAVLAGIYETFIAGYNCRSVRDGAAWRKIESENKANGSFLLLAACRGEPSAYAFCGDAGSEIKIDELAYTRVEAVNALLSALKPMGKPVCWTAACDDRAALLPGRWMDRVRLQPHVMFRVTDALLAFGQAAPACCGSLVIEVTGDTMRPQNNGAYRILSSGGLATAKRSDEKPQFSCGVGALARLLTGFMDAGEAVAAGLAAGEREAVGLLNAMYPKERNFLFELY